MKLQKLLTQTEAELHELIEKMNKLEADKQEVIKEILRVDGKVALLKELVKEES